MRVTDNILFCSQQGVRFAQASLHYGALELVGNLVLGCNQTGIVTTGGAFPGSTVTIARNVLGVSGAGIRIGVDGARIADNELTGDFAARAPADAIVLEAGFDEGAMDAAAITGNRIRNFGGAGIAIRRALGEAMVKSNRIESVGGAAIVMEDDAAARYLCIENNHFLDIGSGFNAANAPYLGVLLFGAERADVVGNVFGRVARQAIQSPLRAALALQACGEGRVADNRFFGIGPERFTGRTIAIATAADFAQLAIDDNAVARVADAADAVQPAPWQAIGVGLRASADGSPNAGNFALAPGVLTLAVNEDSVVVNAFRIRRLAFRARTASIHANRVRAQAALAPAVEVDSVTGCLFNLNDAESAAPTAGVVVPVARIRCQHVSAGSNRLIGSGDLPTLALDAPRFAVVGNITSGPIEVNGAQLPAPWNALNVPA
jgi:hypothetical protein